MNQGNPAVVCFVRASGLAKVTYRDAVVSVPSFDKHDVEFWRVLGAAEKGSEHPLAKALSAYAKQVLEAHSACKHDAVLAYVRLLSHARPVLHPPCLHALCLHSCSLCVC